MTTFIICAMIALAVQQLRVGNLNEASLLILMFGAVAVTVCHFSFEKSEMMSYYEDEIENLESQIASIDQECAELKEEIKKSSQKKSSTKKTKKDEK